MRPSRPPSAPPEPARDTAFGELTLIERIAVGGMAEVFRAREPQRAGAARTVVLKRMLAHIAAEPGAARMFEAEARIGQTVVHPNVVRVLAVGEAEGQPYLCLELVPGLDLGRLRRWLEREGLSLPVELALFVGRELLAGLDAVHQAVDEEGAPLGVVHGDVSPSNVLVSTRGEVKLADFGVAEERLRASFPQAAAGRTRGKLAYLSPEQVRGEPTDRRSDVFSAASVIGELVAGVPLFGRDSDLATLLAVRDARLERLEAIAPSLPAELLEVLGRGLARAPGDRYPSAHAFGTALAPFLPVGARLAADLGALVAQGCGMSAQLAPAGRDDVTVEPPLSDHRVRTIDGRELGPWTFAQLVEAVTLGRLAPDDLVQSDGGWRQVREVEGLASHLPRARVDVDIDVEADLEEEDRPTQAPAGVLELAGGRIVNALARSAATRASGVWICSRAGERKEVYLVDGTPEFVTSNVPSELLGEHLVAKGALTRGELDMALAMLPRFDGRLGDTLAALGLMEPVDLFRHIVEQVREKLLALFTWDTGRAQYSPGVAPPKRSFPLGLDPYRVLLEGIERRIVEGLEHDTFARHITDDLVPGRHPLPGAAPGDVALLASRVRQPTPLQEVIEALEDPSGADVHRPYRIVRLGLALGVVAWSA